MKLWELIREGEKELARVGASAPHIESLLLASLALGKPKAHVLADIRQAVPQDKASLFFRLLRKRTEGIPLEYISRKAQFFDITLEVGPGVFIPRSETEDVALFAERRAKVTGAKRIIDIGCGSGAIAVYLASKLDNCLITATEISRRAIEVAKRNAERIGVAKKVRFVLCDLFPKDGGPFDLVVSNPPYVREEDLPLLPKEVLAEPKEALISPNGTEFYIRILKASRAYLAEKGEIVFEIGGPHWREVALIASTFGTVEVHKDSFGNPRILWVRRLRR